MQQKEQHSTVPWLLLLCMLAAGAGSARGQAFAGAGNTGALAAVRSPLLKWYPPFLNCPAYLHFNIDSQAESRPRGFAPAGVSTEMPGLCHLCVPAARRYARPAVR